MTRKLLLAEDSLTIQKVFDLTFKQSDVSLTMVDNGADVLRLAGEISPGLIVVDLSLPDMDGFEVASALRGADATSSCPILILAGTLPPFDEEKFRRCGANGVLFKPFESQELIDKVDALLRGAEASAAAAAGEAPAPEEPWDFSDILEEVEEEAGKAPAGAAPAGPDLLPGDLGAYTKSGGTVALGDFDVSLDEIETPEGAEYGGPEEPPPAEAPPEQPAPEPVPEKTAPDSPYVEEPSVAEAPAAVTDLTPATEAAPEPEAAGAPEDVREGPAPEAAHMEEFFFEDAPAAITDLTPAIEAAAGPEAMEAPEAPEGMETVEVPEGFGGSPEASEPAHPPVAEETTPGEGVLREQFSARAQEILERVAAEAVEKVMWEMMDRLSAEFSAKVREAVEAVAWDVIPSTAEALIREEIARIREQAREKPS